MPTNNKNINKPTDSQVPTAQPAEAQISPEMSLLLQKMTDMENKMNAMQEAQEKREKELDAREATIMKNVEEMKAKNAEALENVRVVRESKVEIIRKKLAAQPVVRMYLPLEGQEKVGTTHPVIINGLRINVPKGVYVDVPQQVADILRESFQQTEDAGKAFRLDLNRGKSKEGIASDFALN